MRASNSEPSEINVRKASNPPASPALESRFKQAPKASTKASRWGFQGSPTALLSSEDSSPGGDNFGCWYHLFGAALYSLVRPEWKASLCLKVEDVGSYILEGKRVGFTKEAV